MPECPVCGGRGVVLTSSHGIHNVVCPSCRGVSQTSIEIPQSEDDYFRSVAKGLKEIEKQKASWGRECSTCHDKGWVWVLYSHAPCPGCGNPKGLICPVSGEC